MDDPMSFAMHTLPSGMKLYFRHREETWLGCRLQVHVGQRQTPDGKEELPHLLEHLIRAGRGLEGKPSFAGLRAMREERGWRMDNEDLQTDLDTTSFYGVTRLDTAEEFLAHLNDLVRRSDYTDEDVAHEIEVIANEIREWDDYGVSDHGAVETIFRELYRDEHLVRIFSGTTDPSALTADAANAFHARYYDCPNMSLIVMGGLEEKAVVEMATRAFPPGRSGFRRVRRRGPLALHDPRRKTVRAGKMRGADKVTLTYHWTIPPGQCDASRLVTYALYDLMEDRLRNDTPVIYGIEWDTTVYMDHRRVTLETCVSPETEHKVRRTIAATLRDVEAVLAEIPRTKLYAVNNFLLDDQTVKEAIDDAAEDLLVAKRVRTTSECVSLFERVRDQEIRHLLSKYLTPERSFLSIIQT